MDEKPDYETMTLPELEAENQRRLNELMAKGVQVNMSDSTFGYMIMLLEALAGEIVTERCKYENHVRIAHGLDGLESRVREAQLLQGGPVPPQPQDHLGQNGKPRLVK